MKLALNFAFGIVVGYILASEKLYEKLSQVLYWLNTKITNDNIETGASIAAILTAIATFITVREIADQRRASYKPKLIIPDFIYEGTKNPTQEERLPIYWGLKAEDGLKQNDKSFYISVYNVGLGAATHLSIKWSMPIAGAIKKIHSLAEAGGTRLNLYYSGGYLNLDSDIFGTQCGCWDSEQTKENAYALPIGINKEPLKIRLPFSYMILSSLHSSLLGAERKEALSTIGPELTMSIEYLDIGGEKHRARFVITSELVMAASGGDFNDFFKAQLNPRSVR